MNTQACRNCDLSIPQLFQVTHPVKPHASEATAAHHLTAASNSWLHRSLTHVIQFGHGPWLVRSISYDRNAAMAASCRLHSYSQRTGPIAFPNRENPPQRLRDLKHAEDDRTGAPAAPTTQLGGLKVENSSCSSTPREIANRQRIIRKGYLALNRS